MRKIPGLTDGYFISSTGIIYSTNSHRVLKQEIDEDGYHRISFTAPNPTHMAVHRLVYSAWKGKIPVGYVVHHLNNTKWDNDINNLQITTAFLNSRYAAEDGQYHRTFNWTSDVVHKVCHMMEQNIKVQDIAAEFGITPDNKVIYKNFRNQLYNFRKYQRSWIDITSQYNFDGYDGNIPPSSKYRDSEIRDMRKMYTAGKSIDEIYAIYDKTSREYLRRLVTGRKRTKVA